MDVLAATHSVDLVTVLIILGIIALIVFIVKRL